MIDMNKKLLEEIKRFKMMSNYDPSFANLLNEDNKFDKTNLGSIPKLKGKTEKKGNLELDNTDKVAGQTPVAWFKNKGMFNTTQKIIFVKIMGEAGRSNLNLQSYSNKNTQPSPSPSPSPEPKVTPIVLKFNLENVFRFNNVLLNESGELEYQNFKNYFLELKKKHIKVWPKYIQHLKNETAKNQLYLRCWASIDGDPEAIVADTNNIDATFYAPCRVSGGRKRSEADQCLSQKRAEEMLKRLEKDIEDLKGIFKAKGEGQTKKFNGIGWPNGTKETRTENRKLILDEPTKFTYDINDPNIDSNNNNNNNNSNNNNNNNNNKVVEWKNHKNLPVDLYGPYETGEYIYWFCKYYPKKTSKWIIQKNEKEGKVYLMDMSTKDWVTADGTTSVTSNENQIIEECITEKSLKPQGVWEHNGYEVEYYPALNNSSNIMLRKKDLIEAYGDIKNFFRDVPDVDGTAFNGTQNPSITLRTDGATLTGKDGIPFEFKGWFSNSESAKVDVTNFLETEWIQVVVKEHKTGSQTFYEIGKYGLSLGIPTTRFGEKRS